MSTRDLKDLPRRKYFARLPVFAPRIFTGGSRLSRRLHLNVCRFLQFYAVWRPHTRTLQQVADLARMKQTGRRGGGRRTGTLRNACPMEIDEAEDSIIQRAESSSVYSPAHFRSQLDSTPCFLLSALPPARNRFHAASRPLGQLL